MIFKTPSFWYRKPDSATPLTELLTTPLCYLYALGRMVHHSIKRKTSQARMPILCVGNAVAGGGGKTPTALALMDLIREGELARTPYFLSRGYGGRVKGPVIVDPLMDATECGDEPLLLAQKAPTVVSAGRAAGARFCFDHGGDLMIMDDGLQNNSLKKDLSFLVIDGATGFGNQKLLPAGPLREPLNSAFDKADAFILIGADTRQITASLPADKPVFKAQIKPDLPDDLDITRPLIAFAGLARPEKFQKMLTGMNANIVGWHEFPDHYTYKGKDTRAFAQEARDKKRPACNDRKRCHAPEKQRP
ncbi:MAG: tetraacyldisaccharide 4'-kinase [Alphaproteobacteria bacterium]|nr:tetraacyldisaccharide 4'-kinase [Alphaproteobacteria bacterium]